MPCVRDAGPIQRNEEADKGWNQDERTKDIKLVKSFDPCPGGLVV